MANRPTVGSKIINDFNITIGTINGSGSATANLTILRAIFKMGVPVSGKNIFPSNIQGLPTWYSIRVSEKGFLARKEDNDIVIAMNPATLKKELKSVSPGGVLIYNEDYNLEIDRDDISVYPMPVKKILTPHEIPANLKDYVSNMVYVGFLAKIINLDLKKVDEAIRFHFKNKEKPTRANMEIIQSAYDWAGENIQKSDPFTIEEKNITQDKIMTSGNTAAAIGTIYGGMQYCAWYPITPATGMVDSLMEYIPEVRQDPESGKNTYAIVQAEDELSAVGMTIGAGWAGLRSVTATSGPGLSLMAEYIGLAYFSEVPIVIWDVQRTGPSTGLPTRTAQSDLTFANFISHGDKKHIILMPGNINECFEFGWKALNLAERYQTPIMVLIDLDLGMNHWMGEKFQYPDLPIDRGKILWEDDLEKMLKEGKDWGRYLDLDGDGIPYRTVPGNMHPHSAYFARGTGHDEYARYSEEPDVYERIMDRIAKKIDGAIDHLPKPLIDHKEGTEIGIISFGTIDEAIDEARVQLLENGIKTGYMRIRSIPFGKEVTQFINQYKNIFVVEMNRDGQLKQLLTLFSPENASRFNKVAHTDGLSITAEYIVSHILEMRVA